MIKDRILQLKKQKNAVILAHYYTLPEVQEIADYVGDSFYLSKLAAGLENQIIVYCGVAFMGQSGHLLCPGKKVLMPDINADCPMAHMVCKQQIDEARAQYDDLAVVCYINSTAEVKSWCDVSVTSANAVKIVRNLKNKNVLFVPDKNLGRHVARQVPEKNVMTVDGYCPIHDAISAKNVQALKALHPDAKILAHPECNHEVCAMADYLGSTSGIIDCASNDSAEEFIIVTEVGVEYALKKENPQKRFYFPEPVPVCRDMKLITLEKILDVLEKENNRAYVENEHAQKANATLTKMLELAK